MPNVINSLRVRSQLALGLTHRDFGKLLGVSGRTSERWSAHRSGPSREQLLLLVRHVHPVDPGLAAELATALGETLASLGIEKPPPGPRMYLAPQVVDIVVCAAAEAIDVSPRIARTALHAAFKHALALGLDVAAVEAALAPREPAPVASGKRAARS